MSASCCKCHCASGSKAPAAGSTPLPIICMIPRDVNVSRSTNVANRSALAAAPKGKEDFQLYDDEYLKKHFNLPPRALYLDSQRRPLITCPIPPAPKNFNMARKTKLNQMILDGTIDPSEAITAPSVFPYAKSETSARSHHENDEETIYLLQLPDWEFTCPVHKETIRTPRFIWHSTKKPKKDQSGELKPGGGPLHKPKPWLLSRHTDFDLLSQW